MRPWSLSDNFLKRIFKKVKVRVCEMILSERDRERQRETERDRV